MKKILFILLSLAWVSGAARAQATQDSVKVKLETSTGAEIGIDGDISSTNILTKKVAVGKHTVTVRFGTSFLKDYDLEVQADGDHHYKFPINGKLEVTTSPSRAKVYVDGIAQGQSPLSLEILGDHNIRIEHDPLVYFDLTERVSVAPFASLAKNYTLAKRPPRLYGMAMATWSTSGMGAMLGICRRFGAYTRFAMSLNGMLIGCLSPMESLPDGQLSTGPGYYRKDDHTYGLFTAGVMARCHKFVYAYLGVGYAEYIQKYVRDTQYPAPPYADAEIYPYGSNGCALDLGAILKWKALLVSCGYTTIMGKSYPSGERHNEVYVGIGFTIHKNKKQ